MINVDLNVAQALQAIGFIVGAVFAGLAWLRANKAAKTSEINGRKIEEVRHLTNSLTTNAVAAASVEGEAIGNLAGRREQTEERRVETAQTVKDTIAQAHATNDRVGRD